MQKYSLAYDMNAIESGVHHVGSVELRARSASGHPLLNRNRAKGGDRRAYMRAWRARNPGYMARKGREHRERRRLAALALAATNEGNEEQ